MTTKTTYLSPKCACDVTTGDAIHVSISVSGNPVWTTTVSSGSQQSVIPSSMSRDGVTIADHFEVNYVDSSNITVTGMIIDHGEIHNVNSVNVL